ncbi:Uncharacterised protein [Pandoraea pulmonicola]|uniref:Transposase n=1 Tax=Pandoraea pulmonicola TaxID=93221 RepID=A0AAJ4Z865_PANPU|nr:Uncharacterised protein [Pandoraea pulmonicola]
MSKTTRARYTLEFKLKAVRALRRWPRRWMCQAPCFLHMLASPSGRNPVICSSVGSIFMFPAGLVCSGQISLIWLGDRLRFLLPR